MFRALQSVVDKNTYLVERMSAPHLATLKGGEMFFTLNFFPNFVIFIMFLLLVIFLTIHNLGVKKIGDFKCISYLIINTYVVSLLDCCSDGFNLLYANNL